jgi:hypothetical protein
MTDFQFQFDTPPTPPVVPGGTPTLEGTGSGSGACGSGPCGSMTCVSGGGVAVVGAEQVTLNTIRVTLTGPVSVKNRGAIFDALYDRGWSLSRYNDPEVHIPLVYWVERESANTVILQLDAPLDGPGKVYIVTVSDQIAQASSFADRSWLFRTFGEARNTVTPETRRSFDIANLPAGDGGPGVEPALGTFQYDADGDYQNDAGLANYKKRIIRRLTTKQGTFVGKPLYGLNLPEKGPMRPGTFRSVQAQALGQIFQEPGTLTADVSVSSPAPGVFLLSVTGTCSSGAFGVNVTVGKGG